jgi:hypothetical protein
MSVKGVGAGKNRQNIGDDYRGRRKIILDVEKDRPDRPIVQPVVIVWIIKVVMN